MASFDVAGTVHQPLATGMTLTLTLLAMKTQRPRGADVVIWLGLMEGARRVTGV
jgi:hypothetical protein